MNKTEKLICLVLVGILALYIFRSSGRRPQNENPSEPVATNAVETATAAATAQATNVQQAAEVPVAKPAEPPKRALPSVPEQIVVLENGQLKLELSTWGAVVRRATLKEYAKDCGAISAENPAVTLDFAESPLGELAGIPDLAANDAYEVKSQTSNEVVFANGAVTRKVTLGADYRVTYEESLPKTTAGASTLSLGVMRLGDSKNDILSVDSMALDAGKGKPGVIHHCEGDSPLKGLLVGTAGGCSGCSGSPSVSGNLPTENRIAGAQTYVALKNRFFVTALASCDQANEGFVASVARDLRVATYRPESVAARVCFGSLPEKRTTVFYVGPKKQSLLWNLGMKDVMEFGMWRWICYPLVWVLNFFHNLIPNYGVAIILLTILMRILFWPLTRKSTVGMKRMQEIQPLMKEIQAKYKDNPQRMQQEVWQLYREHKVNPLSSCLPMLVQIPVFIALFNVLRSAVELRYASFLWIADLSEPEALFASWFPFGGLNVLPILMAATTALQSFFTPSTGDAKQRRMMMIMMPAMMLVMFYSFPSALSLYWFLSNVFSIVQMWVIRRQTAAKTEVIVPEIVDPPTTRQMRRHG